MALLIALSGIGAYIPVPSPVGSVALDSAPGFFAALSGGAIPGAIVLITGHLFSALRSGFHLGALHIIIALLMGLCGVLLSFLVAKTKSINLSSFLVAIVNGVGLPLVLLPLLGMGVFLGLLAPLLIAAFLNIFCARILYRVFDEEGREAYGYKEA